MNGNIHFDWYEVGKLLLLVLNCKRETEADALEVAKKLAASTSLLENPLKKNKARNTATPVACGWAGAIFEVSGTFGQEQ